MNKNKNEAELIELIAKKQRILDIAEAEADGLTLEISETKPGHFTISRDYTKKSKNIKINRLVRD